MNPYINHFHQIKRECPDLRLERLLSTASKFGNPDRMRAFNLPLIRTCSAPDAGIATPSCQSVCYSRKMAEGRPAVFHRAELNWSIVHRPDFRQVMTGAIHEAGLQIIRLHGFGDYFSSAYVEDWHIVTALCPTVEFLSYTRAWRRPDILPALEAFGARPNVHLHYSADVDTKYPTSGSVAWLSTKDVDVPPDKCTVGFRSHIARKFIPLKQLGNTTVCPHENGMTHYPPACTECRICLKN